MDNVNNLGQNVQIWSESWKQLIPEVEIRMWDYYGGRQYISKYVPRFGKVLEAGCGLGRYVFYFAKLGINIEGLDFSSETIEYLKTWQLKYGFQQKFLVGDVQNLPYESNSLRGYISLGVLEHFIEGPQKAIKEAFRVLEPGGIAIITTPNISWNVFKNKFRIKIKNFVKKIIRYKLTQDTFFQYEYRPNRLAKFIKECGLKVTVCESCDLLYSFLEFYNFNENKIKKGTFAFWFSNKFENTFLRKIGAQSITISVKVADKMYCFLCGKFNAKLNSLDIFTVPICNNCKDTELAKFYVIKNKTRYETEYLFNPPIKSRTNEICEYSGEKYLTDELFEDFGFTKKVSPEILKKPVVNILLSNKHIQPIWRNRKNIWK